MFYYTVQSQAWCVHCSISVPIGLVIQKLTVQANYSNKKKVPPSPQKKKWILCNLIIVVFFPMHHRVKVIKNWLTKLTSWWQSWVERLPLPFIWNSLSEIIMQIYSFSKTQRYLLYASISFSQDDVHAHVHLVGEGKQTISPLNFSLCTVYVLVIWCWHNSPIRVIKGTLYICTLHLSVSIFYVIFSYLFVCI